MLVILMMALPYLLGLGILVYFVCKLICAPRSYKSSAYFQQTGLSYWAVRSDKGKLGEYLTYARLKAYEKNGGKFLFNVYIPKGSNETTELDVVLISSRGLFVFESKNYSGWIFGSETQRNWTQTLPQGRGRSIKERFYNPVMQNQTHIKHLRGFIGESVPVKSIIVFSERCELKGIQIKNNDVKVVNRYNVAPAVASLWDQMIPDVLSAEEIDNLYDKLYPLTQIGRETKNQHIENIKQNYCN